MNSEEQNKLDGLFKKGLDIPDTRFEYNDQDWDEMEQLLDAPKKRRGIIFWLPALGSVAALLLIFLGWWLLIRADNTINPYTVAVKPINKPHQLNVKDSAQAFAGTGAIGKNNVRGANPVSVSVALHPLANNQKQALPYANNKTKHKPTPGAKPSLVQPANSIAAIDQNFNGQNNTGNSLPPINGQKGILAAVPTKGTDETVKKEEKPLSSIIDTSLAGGATLASANTTLPAETNSDKKQDAAKQKRIKATNTSKFKPQFGLAILVSPDINGVASFKQPQVGTNIGMLFSVGITKNLTISTGGNYSRKPYITDFSNYYAGYKFKTDPQQVYADCRVLDIPLNIDYRFYHKSGNSFSVGTGLSSYIMLKESYTYDYADPATVGPAGFSVANRHDHILGVLNLNATYDRQINAKFSIAAQPYFKIPLTDIGNSRVRLQSAGLAVGLRWNINSLQKP
jgi:hypothetical protein